MKKISGRNTEKYLEKKYRRRKTERIRNGITTTPSKPKLP
jgi:hypothetical protein